MQLGGRHRSAGIATVVALAAILLAGCAPTTSATPSRPDPRLIGAWHLTAGSDAHGPFRLAGADITFTIGDSGSTGGRSACTRYTARVTGGPGALFVSTDPRLSDRCQTIPDAILDSRYLDALAATRIADVTPSTLTLRSGAGTLSFAKATTPTTLAGNTWVLDQLSNATSEWLADSVRGAATLRFSNDGVFVISTTCATLRARYRVVGQQVSVQDYSEDVGNGGICNDKTGAVGAEVMTLVGGEFSYELKDGALLMTATGLGTSARFVERG